MHDHTDVASHVAALALLDVDAHRLDTLANQLHVIVQYAHKLYEVDVAHVVPTSHMLCAAVSWREDACAPQSEEDMLGSAPAREGDFFVVPPVIE